MLDRSRKKYPNVEENKNSKVISYKKKIVWDTLANRQPGDLMILLTRILGRGY
jgi:hypothetical protein